MRGKTKQIGNYTIYEVYVYKTQAITYFYGHEWKKFMFEYGLKKGDELKIDNPNGLIFVMAYRLADTTRHILRNFSCTHHIL